MALDDLPGTITQRQLVQDSDSDDEEDFGTFALLKTGNEKKAALREKERLKNLQSMEIGGKAADATEAPVPEVPAASAASPKLSPKPPSPKATAGAKRPRRGAGAGRASRSKAAASNSPQVHDLDGVRGEFLRSPSFVDAEDLDLLHDARPPNLLGWHVLCWVGRAASGLAPSGGRVPATSLSLWTQRAQVLMRHFSRGQWSLAALPSQPVGLPASGCSQLREFLPMR